VATLYFDVTDVVDFATRYSRVTGIQRVQLNIVTLLARQHGGERVRCTYFDNAKQTMLEFDPAQLSANAEFNAEALLADLGVTTGIAWLRGLSKSQVKSFLRRYNNNKLLRAVKKLEIYISALVLPSRLSALGLLAPIRTDDRVKVMLRHVAALPAPSLYVCMGSIWKYPEVLAFAKRHSARGQGVVQMVYDLIPVVHPENYTPAEPREYESWLADAFEYVRSFACISQWTAADLKQFASRFKREIKTRVVPLAHEFYGFERSADVALPAELSSLEGKRFVLCVGTIETRKNGVSLLKAWRELADELGDRMPMLVFAGKYGKGGELVQKMLERDSVLGRLVYLEHAPSDRQLAWLYRNCMFTVFPSTYEGWGLPVGESAWFGKYCVASNATSIPEVCGELLKYVDPTKVESIKAGISEVILDASALQARESDIEQASLRSWADVADDMYAYLTSEAQAVSLPNTSDKRV
jgi:glycosyltransferase involved in cell wall biosynthesis